MSKLTSLCLFLLFCVVLGQNTPITLDSQVNGTVVPCQYLTYSLNLTNSGVTVGDYLSVTFNTDSIYPISVEISNLPYAIWGESSNVSYVGSGATEFTINIICDYPTEPVWYIAVNATEQFGNIVPVNFTIYATQGSVTINEIVVNTPLPVSGDTRINVFGELTDFFHVKLPSAISPGQIAQISVSSTAIISHIYANVDTLAANFDENICLIAGSLLSSSLTIDYCTLQSLGGKDLYFTVVPSTNVSYTVTFTNPSPVLTSISSTATPWTAGATFGNLTSTAVNYYSFTLTNDTAQVVNITISNVQGGTVSFSYSTELPFIACEADSNCYANSPNCCIGVSTSCQLVIQPCNVQSTTYYIGVQATSFTSQTYPVTYEILVSNTQYGSVNELSNSVFVSGSLQQAHYDQYIFDDNGYKIDDYTTLSIHLYVDQSNSAIENLNTTLFINYNDIAGSGLESSCWSSYLSCTINNVGSCTIQLNPCIINDYEDWYVSVYTGYSNNFYNRGVSYTLLADLTEPVELEDPYLVINSVLYANTFDHYKVNSDLLPSNGGFSLLVFNVLGGSVTAYLNYGGLAGPLNTCPSCFNNTESGDATPNQPLTITVANCDDYVDKNSDEVYISIECLSGTVSYSLTVEELKNYKPNNNVKSGTPYVASIGPQSSLNYTIPGSSSDSYLLVSITQIEHAETSPLTMTLYNATSLSCVNDETMFLRTTVNPTNQYASIVVPECDYAFGDGYILVVENPSNNNINYNVYYEAPSSTPIELGNNEAYSESVVTNGREFYTYSPEGDDTLLIEVYFDVCKNITGGNCVGTLSLTTIDPDTDTGCISSEAIDFETSNTKSCVFVRTSCNATVGDIYMIISTTSTLYPDTPLGYTILVSEFNSSVPIQNNRPLNMNIYPSQRIYHTFNYPAPGYYLPTVKLSLSNQQNGTVSAVLAQTPPPNADNNCPCFDYTSQATLPVEYCNAVQGQWTALVQASNSVNSNQLVGYTIALQELNSTLTALSLVAPAQGSVSPFQYAFFNVSAINWNLPTIVSITASGGTVTVYTTTGPTPGTNQCGPRSVLCTSVSQCTQQVSACNSALGTPTFISILGASASSYSPIGYTISILQNTPVVLADKQTSALQQIPANVFYEYNYQLPVTFTAPLVELTLANISVSTGFSVAVYNEIGCFNEAIITKTCNSTSPVCIVDVSACNIVQNSTLYIIVQATGSALNFTITPVFTDLTSSLPIIAIDTPTSVQVAEGSYTVFTTTISDAAPQYSLSYTITSNTTLNNNLHAYANWGSVTPQCSIWNARFILGSVSNSFSSCCVQPGTFSVLVFSPAYANLTITFTQVERITTTTANPPLNTATSYPIASQQTGEFSITLAQTSYYDFFYITVSANASANFYFQHAGLAGPFTGRACYTNSYNCVNSQVCVYKVPQCAFSNGLVDPFVAGTIYFGVQNTQLDNSIDLTFDYGVINYTTLVDNTPAPVTIQPYVAGYGIFPVVFNSINESITFTVNSPNTPYTFNLYSGDCSTSTPYATQQCTNTTCAMTVTTCQGNSNFLVEVTNPYASTSSANITAEIISTYGSPSPLSEAGVPRNNLDAETDYFSAVVDSTLDTAAYAQLVITNYTGLQSQITLKWGIVGVPACFQPLNNYIIWTDNGDGTYNANVILNSCFLTSGTYIFEVTTAAPVSYIISFDSLSQGNPIPIGAPSRVAGQTLVNERTIYNLTIPANAIKPGQSLEITFENQCGESDLYISQGTYSGPECGGTPVQSPAVLDACELLFTPLTAEGDSALYLTVIGVSQSNLQYDIPAQYLITVDVVGEPVNFVPVGLDEIVSNSDNGNTIYVFSISGVDSFVGQLQIGINELENGGVTNLDVSFFESTLCGSDFTISNNNGGPINYFIDSCEINDNGRLIYFQFGGNNTNSKFQITHTRPFIRDLDEFDEEPQNGAVTPSVGNTDTFLDEEYYSISLNEKYIENFLFTAWVTSDDDDESLAQEQAGIQLTAGQVRPPSLCVSSSDPDFHSASFGNKLSWEWCEVNIEEPLYLTVNYPSQDGKRGTEAYPYSLFWSFGLDDEDITPLAANTPSCQSVQGGETNYYGFQLPQNTSTAIYQVDVYAINTDTNTCDTLEVSVAYGGLASTNCNLGEGFTQTCAAPCNGVTSTCSFSLNCPIEWVGTNNNISVSVYAPGTHPVSYFIQFSDEATNAVALNITGPAILAGGDNDEAYYFSLVVPTLDATSSIILDVEPINGNSATAVWFAYDHIPTPSCFDGFLNETTKVQFSIDSCQTLGNTIIIAVNSNAQFYISAYVSTVATTPLALNTYAESFFPAGVSSLDSITTYVLNITADDVANSLFAELSVLVYGINQGTINAWISYGTIGNSNNCYLAKQSISNTTATQTPGPVTLNVDFCGVAPGLYYISLQLVGVSDSCSSVNFGVIASIGLSSVTQNVLVAGTALEMPIPVGTTTIDYYSFTPAANTQIMSLVVDAPENIPYSIAYWTSPYGKSVSNVPTQSCVSATTTSDGTNGVYTMYWWGCEAPGPVTFQVTFTVPADLSVLPGATYSVTASQLSASGLTDAAISAEFGFTYPSINFYSFTANTDNSFVIDIEVTQGPLVGVSIYGGNCTNGINTYITGLVCLMGPCDIPIDWSTTGFQNETQYFVLVAGEAPSKYSIALLAGEDQTCVEPTNTSLCTVDWNVWNYGTGEAGFEQQNAASIALYNELVNKFCPPCECVELSSSCNDSLIEFACTQTYRACDVTGLQASICQDTCEDIEENCGYTFTEVGLPQYSCNHNFYYTDTDGNDVCDDIYGINDTNGDKLLWLIVLIVVALILLVLIAVGAFIFYKKYQQKRNSSYEAIKDGSDSSSSSSSINSDQ